GGDQRGGEVVAGTVDQPVTRAADGATGDVPGLDQHGVSSDAAIRQACLEPGDRRLVVPGAEAQGLVAAVVRVERELERGRTQQASDGKQVTLVVGEYRATLCLPGC